MTIYNCQHCEGYFDESKADSMTKNGSTGMIDNWLPDEDYMICPICGECHEDFEEIEDVDEELNIVLGDVHRLQSEKKGYCETIKGLRDRIEEVEALNGQIVNSLLGSIRTSEKARFWFDKIRALELD